MRESLKGFCESSLSTIFLMRCLIVTEETLSPRDVVAAGIQVGDLYPQLLDAHLLGQVVEACEPKLPVGKRIRRRQIERSACGRRIDLLLVIVVTRDERAIPVALELPGLAVPLGQPRDPMVQDNGHTRVDREDFEVTKDVSLRIVERVVIQLGPIGVEAPVPESCGRIRCLTYQS